MERTPSKLNASDSSPRLRSGRATLALVVLALAASPALAQTRVVTAVVRAVSAAPRPRLVHSSSGTDNCVLCHSPRVAPNDTVAVWGTPGQASSFTMYASPTLRNQMASAPGPVSRTCLSCHDGVSANSSFSANGMAAPRIGAGGQGMRNVDLRGDHPIGLTVGTANPHVKESFKWSGTLPLFGPGKDQLECATCHDPHGNGAPEAGHLLRVDNSASGLCTTCHDH